MLTDSKLTSSDVFAYEFGVYGSVINAKLSKYFKTTK